MGKLNFIDFRPSAIRHHFVNVPIKWEKTLQCNVLSHWLSHWCTGKHYVMDGFQQEQAYYLKQSGVLSRKKCNVNLLFMTFSYHVNPGNQQVSELKHQSSKKKRKTRKQNSVHISWDIVLPGNHWGHPNGTQDLKDPQDTGSNMPDWCP